MLKEARRDLSICFAFLAHRKFDESHALKEYRVMHDQVRLMLTLTEVETDLNQLSQADRHLQDSRRKVKELKEKMTHPQLSTQRVPDPTRFDERIIEVSNRLDQLASAGGPNSNIPSNQSGRNAPNSG